MLFETFTWSSAHVLHLLQIANFVGAVVGNVLLSKVLGQGHSVQSLRILFRIPSTIQPTQKKHAKRGLV